MKRLLSGAAILVLALLACAPARADGWADGFGGQRQYGHIGNSEDRAQRGRATYAGRSNLGMMTSDDEDRPVRRSRSRRAHASHYADSHRGRTARRHHARSVYASDDETPIASRRRTRSGRVASRHYGGGGSSGMASFYSSPQRVASGGWFNPSAMTAAHRSLPFGTRVRVTNVHNGRSAVVRINDRGPYVGGRIIDLSRAAAGAIGMIGQGIAQVRMEVLGR